MSGVYGDLLDSFPELSQLIYFKKNERREAVYIPCVYDNTIKGDMHRQSVGVGNVLGISEKAYLYIASDYEKDVMVGDYFKNPYYDYEMRIVGLVPYGHAGGYNIYTVERVEGHTNEQVEELEVKKGKYL